MKINPTTYSKGGFVRFAEYHDKSPAILIIDDNGQPQIKATVNLENETPDEGCVFLKGWSENDGVPEALVNAGVVELTGRKVRASQWVFALEARLLVDREGNEL